MRLRVKNEEDSTEITFLVKDTTLIKKVKESFIKETGHMFVKLHHNGKLIQDSETPVSLGLKDNDFISAVDVDDKLDKTDYIWVRVVDNVHNDDMPFHVNKTTLMKNLKDNYIKNTAKIDSNQGKLFYYKQKLVGDFETPSSLGLRDNAQWTLT